MPTNKSTLTRITSSHFCSFPHFPLFYGLVDKINFQKCSPIIPPVCHLLTYFFSMMVGWLACRLGRKEGTAKQIGEIGKGEKNSQLSTFRVLAMHLL